MGWKGIAVRILAVFGTVLLWFPIVATVLTGVEGSIAAGALRFDWLMPGELGLFALIGAALLLTASLMSHSRRALVATGIVVMLGAIAAGAAFAQLSGLATGATEPTGWPVAVLIGLVALYTAAMAGLGVAGILVSKDSFTHHVGPAGTATPAA
jgi:hypothetical protein